MLTEAQVVAFEGGQLRTLASGVNSREAVLALPLSRLLVCLVRVPAGEDQIAVATAALQRICPFPDDQLTVGCEKVRDTADGSLVIAAALPESAADDIGEALDAAKLNVIRIDSLVLGQLRGIWSALGDSAGRRLVLIRSADCISAVVLDGDQPSAIRAISEGSELVREVTLSLLEAEDFGGSARLDEIVWVETDGVSGEDADLSSFAPVRRISVGSDAALLGVAERTDDPAALNALPASWHEVLEETRFKAKLFRYLAVAGGLWLLILGVLFGVPVAYGFMTDQEKSRSKQHARQYQAASDMKAKVCLIRKYSDHDRGALEIMKALSDRLPEGVTLSSWTYRREDGVRVSGEANTAEAVYVFKDAMDALSGEEDGEDPVFGKVELSGPNASKGGQRFDLDCRYETEEE